MTALSKTIARSLGCAAFIAMSAASLVSRPAAAQAADAYPAYPVHIVVPYQAGGSTDIVIRKFAELAAPRLGQSIIIENRGGAGATLGARHQDGQAGRLYAGRPAQPGVPHAAHPGHGL